MSSVGAAFCVAVGEANAVVAAGAEVRGGVPLSLERKVRKLRVGRIEMTGCWGESGSAFIAIWG